ncbi:MAG: serine/threonine protein kinase [Myxococcales bacterium]|nr:serine/threonine protein kinase [Myxococcales bacterium]
MDRAGPLVVGRFVLDEPLGTGGSATVYLAVERRADGPALRAVKRLHRERARSAAAVAALLDEVRLTRGIDHPNVVRAIDFVSDGDEHLVVMDYVHGLSLARARPPGARLPPPVAVAIAIDALAGLAAAHETRGPEGELLGLVHRDMTPENVLVGVDGRARITDFGVAKAEGRLQHTTDGSVRGKLAYLAPEQVGGEVSARTDVFAVGLVLWEVLVGERLNQAQSEAEAVAFALDPAVIPPSDRAPGVPAALDAIVMRALAAAPEQRYESASEMAAALGRCGVPAAAPAEVSAWLASVAGPPLAARWRRATLALAREQKGVPTNVRVAVAAAAGLLAVGAVVATWLVLSPSSIAPASSPAATVAVTSALAVPPPPPSIAPSAPPPSIAPSAPPPAASAAPPRPNAPPARPPARGTAAAPCDPPWVVDSRGIRRYNPDCVR